MIFPGQYFPYRLISSRSICQRPQIKSRKRRVNLTIHFEVLCHTIFSRRLRGAGCSRCCGCRCLLFLSLLLFLLLCPQRFADADQYLVHGLGRANALLFGGGAFAGASVIPHTAPLPPLDQSLQCHGIVVFIIIIVVAVVICCGATRLFRRLVFGFKHPRVANGGLVAGTHGQCPTRPVQSFQSTARHVGLHQRPHGG